MGTPFLLRAIIVFIKTQNPNTAHGVALLLALCLCKLVGSFVLAHVNLYTRLLAFKSSNALIAMILQKQFRVSAATNKEFTMGQMINFVQVDANKLVHMSGSLSAVSSLPFLIIFSVGALFYFLGWTFLTAVFILVNTIYVNFWIGKRGE